MTAVRVVEVAIAAILGLALGGCGDASPDRAASERHVRILDETTATFAGVRLGSTSGHIRRHFGPPLKSSDGASTPPGVDYYDVGGPTSVRPPPTLTTSGRGGGAVRYRDTAWLVEGGRSYGVMTVAPDTRTRAGVAIGDAAGRVTDRYSDAPPTRRALTATSAAEDIQRPNQRARLVAPNRSFSAANSRDGS
jgi:hypothetical protein